MDPERITVHQLDDIGYVMMVQCFVKGRIFVDNCINRLNNHVFYGFFHVAAETNEPNKRKKEQNQSRYLVMMKYEHKTFMTFPIPRPAHLQGKNLATTIN